MRYEVARKLALRCEVSKKWFVVGVIRHTEAKPKYPVKFIVGNLTGSFTLFRMTIFSSVARHAGVLSSNIIYIFVHSCANFMSTLCCKEHQLFQELQKIAFFTCKILKKRLYSRKILYKLSSFSLFLQFHAFQRPIFALFSVFQQGFSHDFSPKAAKSYIQR